MRWLKLHTEARNDAKLESLADDEFRVWFRLLCFAGDQPERGLIKGYTEKLLAVEVARGNIDLLRRTISALAELDMVEEIDDEVSFIHWNDRQYDKPSDQPERVAARVSRHRERAGNAALPISNAVKRDVTPSNAHETRRNDIDTDTEIDIYTPLPPEGGEDGTITVVAVDERAEEFEAAWKRYPARRGKKLNKARAKSTFDGQVKRRDYNDFMRAVTNFAASDQAKRGFVEDMHRFIGHWRDWLEPEAPPPDSTVPPSEYRNPLQMDAAKTRAYVEDLKAARSARNGHSPPKPAPASIEFDDEEALPF